MVCFHCSVILPIRLNKFVIEVKELFIIIANYLNFNVLAEL